MGGTKKNPRGKKSKTATRRRTRKGGNGYGFNSGPPLAPGVANFEPNMTSVPNGKPYVVGAGKKRKTGRRRKGGNSVASGYAAFNGKGVAGMADYEAGSQRFTPGVSPTQ
jgi:hypothetical protein